MADEEEKKDPETTEEVSEEKKEAADAVSPSNMVDNANDAAARLERANAKKEKLLDREEALRVKDALGGKAEATSQTKEESDEDYAKKVMANDMEAEK